MDPIRTTSFILRYERLCHFNNVQWVPGRSTTAQTAWRDMATECRTLADVANTVARYEADATYRKMQAIKVTTEIRAMGSPMDETTRRFEIWAQERPDEFLGTSELLRPLLERARKVHDVEREFGVKLSELRGIRNGAEEAQRCAKELLEVLKDNPLAAAAARDVGTHGETGMEWLEAVPLGLQAFIDFLKSDIDAAKARLDDPLGETAEAIARADAEGGTDGD